MVHTKYPKEDCEQRSSISANTQSSEVVQCLDRLSCLNLSLTKYPKPELQSFRSEVPDPKVGSYQVSEKGLRAASSADSGSSEVVQCLN